MRGPTRAAQGDQSNRESTLEADARNKHIAWSVQGGQGTTIACSMNPQLKLLCQDKLLSNSRPASNIRCSCESWAISWTPTGSPSTLPHGTARLGTPASVHKPCSFCWPVSSE